MVRRIKVTRHGLTTCPSCTSHIRVAAVLSETSCPFCGTALSVSAVEDKGGLLQSLTSSIIAGRSSLLVASLLSMGGMAACESDSTNNNPDVVQDINVQPVYGAPADVVMDTEPPQDVPDQPLYGAVPDDVPIPEMDAGTSDADTEPPVQALYGAPADPEDKA